MKTEHELFLILTGRKKGMVITPNRKLTNTEFFNLFERDIKSITREPRLKPTKRQFDKYISVFYLDDGSRVSYFWDRPSNFIFEKLVMGFDFPGPINRMIYDIMVGLGLGYPLCCIIRYLLDRNNDGSLDSLERYLRQAKKKGNPFKLEVNRTHSPQDYDSPYISHIPCSPRCRRSLKMKGTAIRILKLK